MFCLFKYAPRCQSLGLCQCVFCQAVTIQLEEGGNVWTILKVRFGISLSGESHGQSQRTNNEPEGREKTTLRREPD